MPTFLELSRSALKDSGLGSPEALSDVTMATGIESNAVEFVREAWVQIQTDQENWLWMQKSFSARLVGGTERYEATALRDGDGAISMPMGFRSWATSSIWYITDPRQGTVVGAEFPQLIGGYQEWRTLTFNRRLPQQRPIGYAIAPNLDLLVVPTPNDTFDIDGEYQHGVQHFAANDDLPRGLPSDYHNLIKWKGIGMLHGFDEAEASVRYANSQYAVHFNNMKRLYLPAVELAPALGADDYERYDRGTFFGRGFIG